MFQAFHLPSIRSYKNKHLLRKYLEEIRKESDADEVIFMSLCGTPCNNYGSTRIDTSCERHAMSPQEHLQCLISSYDDSFLSVFSAYG